MATDLGQAKSPPAAKYESFVKDQLARAESRIRTLDLAAALLVFAGCTLAYAVALALLDRLLELSPAVRQGACVVYLLAGLAYLTANVFVPLSRRINPYFAARQLERSLPGAKNSVVNWLDLHGENLPSAIHGAVGQRAAHDLGRADLEKAISARRPYWAGGVAALCGLAFLVALFTLGPGLFFAHLGRTFAPFGGNGAAAVPTSTRITVVKPADGVAVVPDARPLEISVRVDGRIPDPRAADALRLLYHYQQTASYVSRPLDKDDNGRWGTTLAPNEVADGFWYKVAGGDAETPEYHVRLTPRVTDFKAVYAFRPYLARVNETRLERKIEAVRGTRVDVTFHANRDLKEGYLKIDGPDGASSVVRGEVLPDDSEGFHARLTLDESGQYRIGFTSVDGETFLETEPAPLIAVPDNAPVVTLTKPVELKEKPGWVSPLQTDALLSVEGNVTDDIGVAAIRLNLRVENGPTLPAQEYRSRDRLALPHGGNPKDVHYEDFVDLAKVKTSDPLFQVRPGMVLEYWLTAEDACDYPKPNIGESKHFRVQIVEPMNNDQAKKDQQQKADQQKQDNDKQQDANNRKEDAKNQQKNEETKKKNGENGSGKEDDKNKKPGEGSSEPKPGDQGSKPKPDDKGNPDGSANQQASNADKTKTNSPQNGDVSKDLDEALKDQQKDQQGAGKNDARQQPAGGAKGAGEQPKDQPAEAKPGPQDKPGDGHDESSAKDQGKPDANQPKQGEGKTGGDPKTQPDAKPGENKQGGDSKAEPEAQPGQGKESKLGASAQPGDAKVGGKPEEQKEAGNDKPQGDPSHDKGATAENKEGSSPDASADGRPAGEAKDKAAPETKAEAKGGGPRKPDDKDGVKSEAKGDGPKPPTGDEKPGDSAKSQGTKTDGQNVAQNKSEGGEGEPLSDEAKRENLKKAVEQLKEALKSNDPQRRKNAEEFIRRHMQNASDPETREAAKKTLQEAGLEPDDTKVAENKPKEAGGPPSDGKQKEQPSEAKGGMGEPSPTAKDTPKDKQGDDTAKGETKGDGKPADKTGMGEAKATPPGEAKGGPGNGAKERHGDPATADDTPTPPVTPEKPVDPKASVLQLRKFLDAVDKKVLEDAKRDPAAMKRLQDEARKWLAEHPPEDDDAPFGPQQGGSLGSKVGRKSNTNDKTAADDPDAGGRPLPPPGYRDPYKEFTKLLSPGGDK